MKGDFSRLTYDPSKHYSGVLMQQGRVQVDADWNEQQEIDARRAQIAAYDIVGPSGAPRTNPGFALSFTPDSTDLIISSGRYYVDGLGCRINDEAVFSFTTDGGSSATLAVAAPGMVDLQPGQWVAFSITGQAGGVARITGVNAVGSGIALTIASAMVAGAPAGSTFNGTLKRVASYLSQADFPSGDAGLVTPAAGTAPAVLNLGAGAATYLVYLDVWQRHISALDDPSIRERALGGPDTATRVQTVSQVRLLKVTPPQPASSQPCRAAYPEWDALLQGSSGALAARSQPAGPAGPCLIPPGGGYQGLENQLYRVEIHDPGTLGVATWKWSRDNGSVVTGIRSMTGTTLVVDSTGPDDALGFANLQWVEIIGDADELQGRPGQLVQIDTVNPALDQITLRSLPVPVDPALHPKLRRWDGAGLQSAAVPATNGGYIALENGVEVQFSSGQYNTGDYWLIPARAGATADIEWPFAVPQPPAGIVHHYARIGLFQWPSTNILDCRPTFLPLTQAPPALHVMAISWPNDDLVETASLTTKGLQITFDQPPVWPSASTDGVIYNSTIGEGSMIVTIEVPAPTTAPPVAGSTVQPARIPVVLTGTISLVNTLLTWTPDSKQITDLLGNISGTQPRLRVALKGSAIWSDLGGERLYLDGAARGQPGVRSSGAANPVRTDLLLPSGARLRASDFESWFYLNYIVPQPVLASLAVSPGVAISTTAVNGAVTLTDNVPAPAAAVVTLASSDSSIATLTSPSAPAGPSTTVTIGVGTASASFGVVVSPNILPGTYRVTVSATHATDAAVSTQLTVVILSVSVAPATGALFAGQTLQFAATVAGNLDPVGTGVSSSVNWTVNNTDGTPAANGGTVDGSGLYTAPGGAGTYLVTATSAADPSKSASAQVTVRVKSKDKDKEALLEKTFDKIILETPVAKLAEKAFEKSFEKAIEKIVEKVREVIMAPAVPVLPNAFHSLSLSVPAAAATMAAAPDSSGARSVQRALSHDSSGRRAPPPDAPVPDAGVARAFIRQQERPDVGSSVIRPHG